MRILMLSHGYPPTLSGVTLVVQKLSRALVRRGHQVLVITASDRGDPYSDEDEGVQLERLRSLNNPFWSNGRIPWASTSRLQKLIDDLRPDLIHSHENAILSFQLLRLPKPAGVPRIASCYFLPRFVTHYLGGLRPLEIGIEAFAWKWGVSILNRYDYVVFSTPTHRQAFIHHGVDVPSTAISNGLDTGRYYPADGQVEAEEIVNSYRLPPRPRILFVGRLMKDKKIDQLVEAMVPVCAQEEAHLLVVGRGDEHDNIVSLSHELGLEDNVHLLGYVPESDLPGIYRSADLFAIASVAEVQSIPVLQAVATGLPIVAANAGALPELVRPEQNGLLVPPDDPHALGEAILKIVANPAYRSELGRESLSMARGHSNEEMFSTFAELYHVLVARGRTEEDKVIYPG